MPEQDSAPFQKQCVACREKILAEATICPRCRSAQKPQRWGTFFSVLKWIGGFTAIISLIIGVRQISGIVQEWRERDEAVNQIVVASRMLVDMKDYQAAWQIAEKATTIAPSSPKAFNQQVDVAMAWLRDIWAQKGKKTYSEIIDPLILTLSQGAGDDNPHRAAEVLSHIGWANFWRLRDKKADYEIDGYFGRALELNPESDYANLFKGFWLLRKYAKNNDDLDRLSEAGAHFSKALKSRENTHFVNKWIIFALTGSQVIGAEVEAIKFANAWRKQEMVPLAPSEKESVLYSILDEFEVLRHDQLSEGSFLPRLMSALSIQEIIDTYLWLFNAVEKKKDWWDNSKLFHLGLISEARGDLKDALDDLVELLNRVKGTASGYRKQARFALCRVITKCLENAAPGCDARIPTSTEHTIFLKDQSQLGIRVENTGMHIMKMIDGPARQGGLMIGDILLMIDNRPIIDTDQLDTTTKDIVAGKRSSAGLLFLRDKQIMYRRLKN